MFLVSLQTIWSGLLVIRTWQSFLETDLKKAQFFELENNKMDGAAYKTRQKKPIIKAVSSRNSHDVPSSGDNFTRLFNLLSSQTGEVSDAAKKIWGNFLVIHDEQSFAHQASFPFSLKMTLGIAQWFVQRVKQINQSVVRSPSHWFSLN